MRFPLLALFTLLAIDGALDLYIYRILRRRCTRRLWSAIQGWSALVFAIVIVGMIGLSVMRTGLSVKIVFWTLFACLSVYAVKLVFVVFDLLASIPALWHGKRIKALTWCGLGLGVAVFALLWHGTLFNRYNLNVTEQTVEIPGLAPSFDGYRIVQLSDMHVGTYGEDTVFVSHIVDRVNALHPDLIVFTGDIVNMCTDELVPFTSVLSRLHAKDGVYSIYGNHDYGDYSRWPSPEAKEADHLRLGRMEEDMGWHMLNNSYTALTNGIDSLMLIGVENIGDPPFHTYGDLHKAYATPGDSLPKILLSHNPAHWEREIADNDSMNVALTLSGHTHAMQMALGGYSPSSWRYKTWGGMYSDKAGRHIYVNIGTGTVGMPARIGSARPEITVFTLKSIR